MVIKEERKKWPGGHFSIQAEEELCFVVEMKWKWKWIGIMRSMDGERIVEIYVNGWVEANECGEVKLSKKTKSAAINDNSRE